VIPQLAFFLSLKVLGWSMLGRLDPKYGWVRAGIALPLGVSVFVVVYLASLWLGTALRLQTAWALWIALVALGLPGGWAWRRGVSVTRPLLWSCALTVGAILFARWFAFTTYATDSLEMLRVGETLFRYGFDPEAAETLHSQRFFGRVGLWWPLLHSAARHLGLDYFWALIPLYAIELVALLIAWIAGALKHATGQKGLSITIALLTVGLWVTTHGFLGHSGFLKHNLMVAMHLCAGYALVWVSHRTGLVKLVWPAVLVVASSALMRLEAPIMVVAVGALFWRVQVLRPRDVALLFLTIGGLVMANEGLILSMGSSGLRSTTTFWAMLGLGLMTGVASLTLFHAGWFSWVSRARPHLDAVVLLALLALPVWGMVWNPMQQSWAALAMTTNILFSGQWQLFWFTVAFLWGATLWHQRGERWEDERPFREALHGGILAQVFLIFGIVVFRKGSLRPDFMDSGNRMLFHVTPLVLFALAQRLGATLGEPKEGT
jgi:hypothetical protein